MAVSSCTTQPMRKAFGFFRWGAKTNGSLFMQVRTKLCKAVDWVGSESFAYGRFRSGRAGYWIRNLENGAEIELRGMDLSRVVFRNNVMAFMSFHPNGREVVWVSDEGKNEVWALEDVAPTQNAPARN